MRVRKSPNQPSTVAVTDVAVAAARAGVPVEVTQEKKPAPVDEWTRVAQLVLAVAAIVSFGMFIVLAIGEDGLRLSSVKTTSTAKTGGKAGQAITRTTTTKTPVSKVAKPPSSNAAKAAAAKAAAAKAARTTKTDVKSVVVTPRTRVKVADQTRPSDTITGLMGGLALAFFLVGATLPRLRSLEFQGLKLGLAGGDEDEQEAAGVAAGKVAEAAAKAVPSPKLRELVGDDVFTATYARRPDVVLLEDDAPVQEWAQAAVAETMRAARAAKFEAALAGGDPAEATLSEAEIDAIVKDTRPRGMY